MNDCSDDLQATREAVGARPAAMDRRAQADTYATIGRVSGSLAHELGSALSVIGLRAALIVQRTAVTDATHQQALAIVHEVERVTAFMRKLLDPSRRHGIVFRSLDVRAVVASATADAASLANEAIEIALAAPAEPIIVHGDETLLAHALRNVIRNAVQAVRERAGQRRIAIRVRAEGDRAAIEVEDNGPGIAEDQIGHVFEPFRSTKSAGEGMGLGLAISHGIVVEHGGAMNVANRTEGGVCVTLRLPCGTSEASA